MLVVIRVKDNGQCHEPLISSRFTITHVSAKVRQFLMDFQFSIVV